MVVPEMSGAGVGDGMRSFWDVAFPTPKLGHPYDEASQQFMVDLVEDVGLHLGRSA